MNNQANEGTQSVQYSRPDGSLMELDERAVDFMDPGLSADRSWIISTSRNSRRLDLTQFILHDI